MEITEERLREIFQEEFVKLQPCTCQYGNDNGRFTPYWYTSVRMCVKHRHLSAWLDEQPSGLTPEGTSAVSKEREG